MSTKVADDIPEEIIVQILHKLPVKSLVRFTCVCKPWLSLIKSLSFISDHLKHSISSSDENPLLFLHYCSNQDQSNHSLCFDNEEYDHYMDLHCPFKTQNPESHSRVAGTVNGLICLLDHDLQFNKKTFIIWNPLVKNVHYLRPLVCKESIAVLVEASRLTGVHVWVMKEYGVVESWTKILSFDEEVRSWPYVFGFRRNGEVFLQMPDGEMVSWEPESRENKSLGVDGLDPFVHYFVESLELLDNANAQSDPSVENDAIGDAAGE